MRTIRLLATSLLVALSMGVNSCGGDEFEEIQMDELYNHGDSYSTPVGGIKLVHI